MGDSLALAVSGNRERVMGKGLYCLQMFPREFPAGLVHLAKHSPSRDLPSVQQDSLIAVCGEEPSAFPPLRDSSGIPGRKLLSVLALYPEMDQFDLVWTTIPVMMLTGSKAPSMKASFWKGLCEAFKYFDLIPVCGFLPHSQTSLSF